MRSKTVLCLVIVFVLCLSCSSALASKTYGTPYITIRFPDSNIVYEGAEKVRSLDQDGYLQALFPNANFNLVSFDTSRELIWFTFGNEFYDNIDSELSFTKTDINNLLDELAAEILDNEYASTKTGYYTIKTNGIVLTINSSYQDGSEILLHIIMFTKRSGTQCVCILGCISSSIIDAATHSYIKSVVKNDTFYPGTLATLSSSSTTSAESSFQPTSTPQPLTSNSTLSTLDPFVIIVCLVIFCFIWLAFYIKRNPYHHVVLRFIFVLILWFVVYLVLNMCLSYFFNARLGYLIPLVFFYVGRKHYKWIGDRAEQARYDMPLDPSTGNTENKIISIVLWGIAIIINILPRAAILFVIGAPWWLALIIAAVLLFTAGSGLGAITTALYVWAAITVYKNPTDINITVYFVSLGIQVLKTLLKLIPTGSKNGE